MSLAIEEFTGLDLVEAKKRLDGKSLFKAIEDQDAEAFYVVVFISERHDNPALKFGEVMRRPLGDIMEAFEEANTEVDPPDAGSGAS